MKAILLILNLIIVFSSFSQSNSNYHKTWGTYFGGQGTRIVNSVVDSENNIIVAGIIIGGNTNALQDEAYYNQFATILNPTYLYNPSIVSLSGTYSYQSIIAKFSPNGDLLQSLYLPMEIFFMKINKEGEIFISASTMQNNIGTAGVWYSSPLIELGTESQKSIVVKLNTDFTINWLTYLPTNEIVFFDLDNNDNIYAATTTHINNSITTIGSFQPNFITESNNSGFTYSNAYLCKIDNEGQLQWGSYYGFASPLAISYTNNEFLLSSQKLQDNPTIYDAIYYTFDAYQQTPSTQIISKFNTLTGQRIYSTYLGNNNLTITQIVGKDNNIYLLGNVFGSSLSDTNLINSNSYQQTFNGIQDVYLGKFNSNFTPIWGTYIGGDDYEETIFQSDLTIKENALYFNGFSYSADFINLTNTYQEINRGGGDLFMMKFSLNGQAIWGSFFGGNSQEIYGNIIPVEDDLFYWVGETHSQNYISTLESFQQNMSINPAYNSFNLGNGFVSKFVPENLDTEDYTINDLIIFPNPSNGTITIKTDSTLLIESQLTLYNSLGQCLLSKRLTFNNEYSINLNFLPNGIYYIVLKSINTQKVFKQKLIIN